MKRILFWFRRDLRLTDNRGLKEAEREGDVFPCYAVDPTHSSWPHRCGDRLHFKLEAVKSLRKSIRDLGGELYVRTGPASEVIPEIAEELSADAVFWNRAYEPFEINRDESTKAVLEEAGRSVKTFKDQVLFEEEEILTNEGSPYEVFTYYAKKWRKQEKPAPVDSVSSFAKKSDLRCGRIPSVKTLGLQKRLKNIEWEPAEKKARNRMEQFFAESIRSYHRDRDYPGREGTSKLSPYLRFGLISPRELVDRAQSLKQQASKSEQKGFKTFVDELIWRDFYHQILYNYPHVTEQNFKETFDDLPWEDHPDWLQSWKQGETGFPIVDAAMRQLNQTGWMHNRLRMIVAQFLTKHCLIHWKAGETYFMNRLLDGDTAANNGGWQWSASTGTDAAPYFRVFNPISQSKKYDPEGEFISSYCPELAELPASDIHTPFRADTQTLQEAGIELGSTYPDPILDHNQRREHAIEVFKSVT